METATTIQDHLDACHCSETIYHHGPTSLGVVMTEGVHYLRSAAECHWLMDIIWSAQITPRVRPESFQVWRLNHIDETTVVVTCTDGGKGDDEHLLYTQRVELTTFPLDELRLYAVREGGHLLILLPSEY